NPGVTTSPQPQTCGLIGNDLWYTFTTGAAGNYTVATCAGSTSDSAIEVFSDCNTSVACNDDFCGLQSTINICNAPASTTYLIRMGGFNGARWAGTFNISYSNGNAAPYTEP